MADRARLLLIVGYAAALAVGAYEIRRGSSAVVPPAVPTQPAEAIPALVLPQDTHNTLAAYDAIIQRPLFSPDRRPAPAADSGTPGEQASYEQGTTEVDGFRLTAVIRGAGNTTVLIEDRSGQTRTLHAGDRLGNWQLGEILDDRVTLLAGGRQETLLVYDFSSGAEPTARPGSRRFVRPVPSTRPTPQIQNKPPVPMQNKP